MCTGPGPPCGSIARWKRDPGEDSPQSEQVWLLKRGNGVRAQGSPDPSGGLLLGEKKDENIQISNYRSPTPGLSKYNNASFVLILSVAFAYPFSKDFRKRIPLSSCGNLLLSLVVRSPELHC